MIDRIESEMHGTRVALNLRTYRQEVLASNIANADTPYFKARDIDFSSALDKAMTGRGMGNLAMAQTSPNHLAGEAGSNQYGADLLYRSEYQGSVDGNTVNMDVERSAIAENEVRIEAALTFISHHFRDLQAAAQA
jgi:flagellar basal-body rod protein FlgB